MKLQTLRHAVLSVAVCLGACAAAPQGGLSEVMQRPAERALLAGLRAYDDALYRDAERDSAVPWPAGS